MALLDAYSGTVARLIGDTDSAGVGRTCGVKTDVVPGRRKPGVAGCEEQATDLYILNADGTGATEGAKRGGCLRPGVTAGKGPMNHLFSLVTVLVLVTTACGSSQGSGKATQTTSPAAGHAGTVAFASDRAGSFDIYVVNTDGTGLARLTSDDPGVEIHPVWSPDGTRIAYSSGPRATESGLYEIWVMNADGSGKRRLTGGSDDRWPAWSPDGSRIVFSRYPFPESPHLFTMNADGTDVQQLTFGLSVDDHPTWTTNDQILFRRNLTDGPYSDIFIMNADGSEIRRLTRGQEVSDYGVSSDGTELVFHDGKHERIMLLSAYGSGDAEALVDSKQLEQALQEESFGTPHLHPAWSPDGLWVAFAGDYGQTSNLRVVSVDGTGLVGVRHGEDATDPAWRPVVAP